MKRFILLICLFAMALGVHAANKSYRDFTDTQGRTIRGRVVAYDEKKGVVTFERDNRKRSKVPLTIFADIDQAYIRDWNLLNKFKSSRFKISANRKKKAGESTQSYSTKKKVEETHYEIQLENRSAYTFKNLKLIYGIYYEQEEMKGSQETCLQGVYCDESTIEIMMPKTKEVIRTEVISTYTQELGAGWVRVEEDGNYNSSDNVQRGEIHGLWVRIELTLPSGQTEIREFCHPDSLNNNRSWVSSTIRAGMN